MMGIPISIPGLQIDGTDGGQATNVLCLMNMVTMEELKDDEEYESEWVWPLKGVFCVLYSTVGVVTEGCVLCLV